MIGLAIAYINAVALLLAFAMSRALGFGLWATVALMVVANVAAVMASVFVYGALDESADPMARAIRERAARPVDE